MKKKEKLIMFLSLRACNYFFSSCCSFAYFSDRRKEKVGLMTVKCNLGTAFVKRGTGEEEKVTEGGRRGRVWVTLLCASFYCPFI